MEEKAVNKILKTILGEDDYNELTTKTLHYFCNRQECTFNEDLNDIEPIMEACCIAILLIGISKKTVNIEEYRITLDKDRELKVGTKEFCFDFEKYIQEVEEYKIGLLRKIK